MERREESNPRAGEFQPAGLAELGPQPHLPAHTQPYSRRTKAANDRTGGKMDAPMSSSQPGGDYDLSNPINSFVEVVRRVVRSPSDFFSPVPRHGNLLAPLVFAMI